MPICAWYASCKRNATKPFLVPAEECLCKSLHTLYLFILPSQVKNGKETAPARRRFLQSLERGGYPRRIFYEWSDCSGFAWVVIGISLVRYKLLLDTEDELERNSPFSAEQVPGPCQCLRGCLLAGGE